MMGYSGRYMALGVALFLLMVFGEGLIVHVIRYGDCCSAVYRVEPTTEGLRALSRLLHVLHVVDASSLTNPHWSLIFMRAPLSR